MSAKKLVYCGMCLALAAVTGLICLYTFPFGGTVTLCSMLFICLPGWFYGFGYSAIVGLLYGIINFMLMPYFVTLPQFILDYILAFSIMSVCALFKDSKKGLIKGYLFGVLARWIVASIAGLIWVSLGSVAWEGWAPLPYSMAYNGAYIFSEAFITVIILLIPAVSTSLERVKKIANK